MSKAILLQVNIISGFETVDYPIVPNRMMTLGMFKALLKQLLIKTNIQKVSERMAEIDNRALLYLRMHQ